MAKLQRSEHKLDRDRKCRRFEKFETEMLFLLQFSKYEIYI